MCADGDCATSERPATSQRVPDPTTSLALGAAFGDPEACGGDSAFKNCHYSVLNARGFEPHQAVTGGTCRGIRAEDGRETSWYPGEVDFIADAEGRLVNGNVGCQPHDALSAVWIEIGGTVTNRINAPWR